MSELLSVKKTKYFGLIGTILHALLASFMVLANPIGSNYTISEHIASEAWSIGFFAALNTIAIALIATSLYRICKLFDRKYLYKVLSAVIVLCFFLVGVFPDTGTGLNTTIHLASAWGFVLVTPIWALITAIQLHQQRKLSNIAKYITWIFLLKFITLFMIKFIFPDFYNNYILYIESTEVLSNFIIIQVFALTVGDDDVKS